jgi:uncharacterized protein YndB with AHSA1/START domain
MKRDLRFEVTYPHPPERVWRALTDREALREWLMDSTFLEARVGHRFEFHTTPRPGFDGIVYCEVTAADPPHRLAYTWRGGWARRPTVVTYTLEPALSCMLGSGWKKILRDSLRRFLDRKLGTKKPIQGGAQRVP